MLSSMGAGFAAFSETFGAGQGFGWHQRAASYWHGMDAFTRVALPAELVGAAVAAMPGVAASLAAGGAVAASLGDNVMAEAHFRAALAMHHRLGAAGWARLSEHPHLAVHLRDSLRMGTRCSYTPAEPTGWKVS